MKKYFLLFTVLLSGTIYSQGEWIILPNAPFVQRNDDAFFVTPETGWVVNGWGEIWKTNDGGESWWKQFNSPTTYFRSVGFVDSLTGFAGNLGTEEFGGATDANLIYKTINGGRNWEPVSINSGQPRGICGIFVVNNDVIYAAGRVRGPSYFIRSTDGGNTFSAIDLNPYAAGLLDLYFFNPDTGFVLGLTNSTHAQSSGIVLKTTDGGFSWDTVYISNRNGEWCWKINFPSKKVGYISLQRNVGSSVNFLKTTDGGNSWFEKEFSTQPYFVQ